MTGRGSDRMARSVALPPTKNACQRPTSGGYNFQNSSKKQRHILNHFQIVMQDYQPPANLASRQFSTLTPISEYDQQALIRDLATRCVWVRLILLNDLNVVDKARVFYQVVIQKGRL